MKVVRLSSYNLALAELLTPGTNQTKKPQDCWRRVVSEQYMDERSTGHLQRRQLTTARSVYLGFPLCRIFPALRDAVKDLRTLSVALL